MRLERRKICFCDGSRGKGLREKINLICKVPVGLQYKWHQMQMVLEIRKTLPPSTVFHIFCFLAEANAIGNTGGSTCTFQRRVLQPGAERIEGTYLPRQVTPDRLKLHQLSRNSRKGWFSSVLRGVQCQDSAHADHFPLAPSFLDMDLYVLNSI